MKKIRKWISDHKPTKRRIIQLYAALLTNANIKGFTTGKIYQGNIKSVCAPGLNCYSCPGASAACPLGALQNALSNSGARLPYYVFGILLLYGLLFGRWICGFLCPFGLIQDLLHKIKTPKLKKSRFTRVLSYLKYVILIVFVVALPLIYALQAASLPLPAFCKYICPAGTLLGAGGLLSNESNDYMFGMLGPLFTWKFAILVVIIAATVFVYRFFCRFFCPLGAIYGMFNKISLLGMKVDEPNCTNCGLCVGKCQMDVRHVGDHECISCGCCIDACPTKAISFKGPKILLAKSETGNNLEGKETNTLPKKTLFARIAVALVMAAVLIGALVYYNVIDKNPAPSTPTEPTVKTSPGPSYGNQVGDLCYEYDLRVYGSDETINIADMRGKMTIINFWGTWCTPCVAELLNEFPQIAEEYQENVAIITVHSYDEFGVDVSKYIETTFPGCSYIFTRDAEANAYCNMLGGGTAWPHTVIIDKDGVIVSVIPRATTYEELKTVIDSTLGK